MLSRPQPDCGENILSASSRVRKVSGSLTPADPAVAEPVKNFLVSQEQVSGFLKQNPSCETGLSAGSKVAL